MPFTASHPAIVLPLARTGLPLSALVAGSMTPDLPLLVHVPRWYGLTHSARGIVTVDVVLTLVSLVVWVYVVRDALVDLAPRRWRERLPVRARLDARAWLLALPAAVVGSASHVGWDLFTHPGRWGTRHVPWLHHDHLGLAGDAWAQYGSGVVGLAVGVVYLLRRVLERPTQRTAPRSLALGTWAVPAVVVVAAAVGAVTLSAYLHADLHRMAFESVTAALAAGLVGLVLLGAAWQASAARAR